MFIFNDYCGFLFILFWHIKSIGEHENAIFKKIKNIKNIKKDTGNREYTIEYDNSQPSEEDEPEPETNKINEVPPSPPEMPTSGGLIGDRIKLPVRRATSSRYFRKHGHFFTFFLKNHFLSSS